MILNTIGVIEIMRIFLAAKESKAVVTL